MENDTIKDIGLRLAKARKKAGFTQEGLAEQTGLSIKMLSAAENGHKAMRPENIIKICESLSITTDYLLKGDVSGHNLTVDQARIGQLTTKQKEALNNIVSDFLAAFDS